MAPAEQLTCLLIFPLCSLQTWGCGIPKDKGLMCMSQTLILDGHGANQGLLVDKNFW